MKLWFKNAKQKLVTLQYPKISEDDQNKIQKYEMSIWAFNGGDREFGGMETEQTMETCRNIAKDKRKELHAFMLTLYAKYKVDGNHEIWTDGTIREKK